jgi:hypothetical protein
MICFRCEKEISDDSPFCPFCGPHIKRKLKKDTTATATDAPNTIYIPYFLLPIKKDDTLVKKVIRLFRPKKGIRITIDT